MTSRLIAHFITRLLLAATVYVSFGQSLALEPGPVLTSVIPSALPAGTGQRQLITVTASSGLTDSSLILVNGTALQTARETGLVFGYVPPELTATVGILQITVASPAHGPSNSLELRISPPISISAIDPASASAGSGDFVLRVTGTNFAPDAKVLWGANQTQLATTYVSATALAAAVPSSEIAYAGPFPIRVASGGLVAAAMTLTVSGAPYITPAGIVDAASYNHSVAPGGLISIFGSELAAEEAAASGMPLPNALKGAVVKINGTPAPLLFVSPGQINAQVPSGTPIGAAMVVVESGGRASRTEPLLSAASAPAVFTLPGGNHAIAQNHPDYSLNTSDNPVSPGGYVVLYATGLGQTDHPVEDGAAPPDGVLCRALADVTVKIGGKDAEVLYAGLTPGFVGLAQINLKVPDVPAGEQPVAITVGGITPNPTLLSIGSPH